ncbi:hypothetical protein [Tenggerimyces flavus]|uniref:Uncharacterized protein n=1 Tax=Tenggerimyces flavus TaxID=1708749 RepID=A0ABV7YMW7_9ACTN|nr:hypothetical protein [Tenggerimyces flavus]MBM7789635.1 hypothetical protein [Tenggerimyces flavus]
MDARSGPTRRQVIGGIGGIGAAAMLVGGAGPAAAAADLPIFTFSLQLSRRDDLVNLRFELDNVTISPDGTTLRRGIDLPGLPSRLIVHFPPQSLAEVTSLDDDPLPALPVRAVLARESRLAFDITNSLPMPLTIERLLAWNSHVALLPPNATSTRPMCYVPNLREPQAAETAIELPWKLVTSPIALGGWAHRTAPRTGASGWTELWHTRLGVRDPGAPGGVDEIHPAGRVIRAVWARYPQFALWLANPDLVPEGQSPGPNDPPALAMDAKSRYEIVRLSSDSSLDTSTACTQPILGPRRHPNRREPVNVDLLMLTSLGGWLDSSSYWSRLDTSQDTFGTNLESWTHRATMGRDHYVRIVRRGFLFPFGHRAVFVELSERKLLGAGPTRAAYLRKRYFIVVRQPTKSYAGDSAMPHDGRGVPFTTVRVLTRITPNLKAPSASKLISSISHDDAFIPTLAVGDDRFQFLFRGTDHADRAVDFRAPAVFVADESPPTNPTLVHDVIEAYANFADDGLREADFGRKHTVVANPGSDPASTNLLVRSAQLAGEEPVGAVPEGTARFYPKVAELSVDLPEVRALAGADAQVARFSYATFYLDNGFSAVNVGQVFLEVEEGKETALGFATDRSGGVATPNLTIRGMSRKRGPVTETGGNAAAEKFDPSAMFAVGATLLGGVTLGDLLAPLGANPNPGQAPQLTSRELGDGKVETRLSWKPTLRDLPLVKTNGSELELRARVVAAKDEPPYYEINGRLTDFTLSFIDGTYIEVEVGVLRFASSSDQKPDVDCDIRDVRFLGELDFVRELAELCGFGDGGGVWIEPAADRISIGLDVPLPSLSVGILALENIKVSVGLVIPFDSTPVLLRVAFCSREDPFTLQVMMFRGSGFVAVELGAHGLDMIEFSFEFGVGMSIDLGVASGTVEIMGGLYYQLSNNGGGDADQTVDFTMYLRMRGELDVLGLISASLEFYLSLDYSSADDCMYGEATLTVSIDLFIFSGEVEVTCRRELRRGSGSAALSAPNARSRRGTAALDAGDEGMPIRFGDAMTAGHWDSYCKTFAAL